MIRCRAILWGEGARTHTNAHMYAYARLCNKLLSTCPTRGADLYFAFRKSSGYASSSTNYRLTTTRCAPPSLTHWRQTEWMGY